MQPSIFPARLGLLLLLLLSSLTLRAQYQQLAANSVVASSNSTVNPAYAVDNDPAHYAVLRPSLLLGNVFLRLGLPQTALAGQPAGLVLVASNGLLNAAALSGLTINTYLSPATTPQESLSAGSLLNLVLFNSGTPTTATFTPTKPFNQIELVAAGLANVYQVGVASGFGTIAAPLPVQLVDFRGQAQPGGVQLSWQTASELNSSYFEVQRSADGESFAVLGRVAGAGTTAQARSYQFADAAPLPLGYYRLRQVDDDGTASYSAVLSVRATLATTVQAYPSPAGATLTVVCAAPTVLDLFDQQGRHLRQVATGAGAQQLDIGSLPTGLYVLREASTGQYLRFEKAP